MPVPSPGFVVVVFSTVRGNVVDNDNTAASGATTQTIICLALFADAAVVAVALVADNNF